MAAGRSTDFADIAVRPLIVATFFACTAALAAPRDVGPYEIIRGGDLPVCRAVTRNLNALRSEPPMVCERKLHPQSKDLSLPDWQPMSDDSALQAVLALKKAQAEKGPPDQAEARYSQMKSKVEIQRSAGQLKAWQATFDLAKSGEKVRVVLVRTDECRIENNFSSGDPIVGVLLTDKFQVDLRYRHLSHIDGDVVLHMGTAYVLNWQEYPGGTLIEPVPPRKQHKGYVFVSPPYWLRNDYGGGPQQTGIADPICQIGYQRLDKDKEGRRK